MMRLWRSDAEAPAIIFINRYFHPDHSASSQMLSDLAFALARRGARVRVIASRQCYDAPGARLPVSETIDGVAVERVWTTRCGRDTVPGRLLDYLTFHLSAAWRLWRMARRGDIVVCNTDPPLLSVITAPIARLCGARRVDWLQDLFPEVAAAVGLGGAWMRRVYRLLLGPRNRALRAADCTVAIGERMAQRLIDLGVARDRIRIIPNMADGRLIHPIEPARNELRASWGLQDAFVVGYCGNLGRAHEIDTLLAAIERTERTAPPEPNPAVTWLFVGGGSASARLQTEAARRGLRSVRFEPYQPRDRLAASLSAAVVHLITLRPELEGLIVPSKLYGIMAAGRPAIFIGDGDGEIARVLGEHRCGLTVAQGDGTGLADAIARLRRDPTAACDMGARARAAFERNFDIAHAADRWSDVLHAMAAANGGGPVPRGPVGGLSSSGPE